MYLINLENAVLNEFHSLISASQMKKFLKELEEMFTSFLEWLGLAWWIEVVTSYPQCTYYFGPFISLRAAHNAQAGYIEDLLQESAKIISVKLNRGQPMSLTICTGEISSSELPTSTAQFMKD